MFGTMCDSKSSNIQLPYVVWNTKMISRKFHIYQAQTKNDAKVESVAHLTEAWKFGPPWKRTKVLAGNYNADNFTQGRWPSQKAHFCLITISLVEISDIAYWLKYSFTHLAEAMKIQKYASFKNLDFAFLCNFSTTFGFKRFCETN